MKIFVVFSAISIGLVAGGASHAHQNGAKVKDNIASGTQHRELVDVPYSVEYTNVGGGSYHQGSGGDSYGRSYQQPSYQNSGAGASYDRGYEQQPQFEIQRSQPIYQNSYSQSQQAPPQTQSRQYVDVPYTVERNPGPSRNYYQPEVQQQQRNYVQPQQQYVPQRSYSPPQQNIRPQPQQQFVPQRSYSPPQQNIRPQPQQQLVDVPYTVEVRNPAKQEASYNRDNSASLSRSYLPPTPQVQRTPAFQQQRAYSPPVQSNSRQAKQYVDVPYTVQTTKTSSADSGYKYLPYSAGNSLQTQLPQQKALGSQYIDLPYQVLGGPTGVAGGVGAANNFRSLPYSLGNTLPITSLGAGIGAGYGGYANPLTSSILPIY